MKPNNIKNVSYLTWANKLNLSAECMEIIEELCWLSCDDKNITERKTLQSLRELSEEEIQQTFEEFKRSEDI